MEWGTVLVKQILRRNAKTNETNQSENVKTEDNNREESATDYFTGGSKLLYLLYIHITTATLVFPALFNTISKTRFY